MGKQIAGIFDEEDLYEESLSKKHQEALHLYRKQKPRVDITNINDLANRSHR